MEILSALGVNSTVWVQLACFIVAYLALSQLIFKPYLAAYQERSKRTVGSEQYAERIIEETRQLQSQYESKARAINQDYKAIYDESRTKAMREQDAVVSRARAEASTLLVEQRALIQREVENAHRELSHKISPVALVMASKLLGKELS
jgi:F-type H+-transporting ATPase subunit b